MYIHTYIHIYLINKSIEFNFLHFFLCCTLYQITGVEVSFGYASLYKDNRRASICSVNCKYVGNLKEKEVKVKEAEEVEGGKGFLKRTIEKCFFVFCNFVIFFFFFNFFLFL